MKLLAKTRTVAPLATKFPVRCGAGYPLVAGRHAGFLGQALALPCVYVCIERSCR
jgi:hypothetical protein